ncbi:hypothetical protein Dimus_029457 [Dionaea muscipula]
MKTRRRRPASSDYGQTAVGQHQGQQGKAPPAPPLSAFYRLPYCSTTANGNLSHRR